MKIQGIAWNATVTDPFDLEAASAELASAGVQLLGDTHRLDSGYAYRYFRGPDGQVYGLNEDRRRAGATQ